MVAPLIIAGAVMAASALAQAYVANKKQGAAKDKLNQIKAEYEKIKPPNFDEDIEAWAAKHPDLLPKAADIPSFEYLTPEQYKVIEKYNPEYASFIQQQAPQVVQRSQVGEEGLQAQRDVLRKLMMTGQLDQDPELMQKFAEAERNAQIGAQSRQQSLMQDFARRGQGGAGLQLASQMGAGAEAMDRVAQTSQDAASQAYKNRLAQLMSGAQLGSQMEQADISLQGRNADIINRFNEMTSKSAQDYANQRANTANQAQRFNIDQGQEVANRNVGATNAYKGQMADIAKWGYNTTNQNRQQAFENKIRGMQSENAAKGDNYNVAMDKVRVLSSQPTVDKWGYMAPIVQGASNFSAQYASNKMAEDTANTAQDREDARLQYERTGQWPTSRGS